MLRDLVRRSPFLACVALAACIDLEKSVTLEKDLSGRASYSLAIDVDQAARLSLESGGGRYSRGEAPSKAVLKEAKKRLLHPGGDPADDPFDFDFQLRSLEKRAPKGVTIRERKTWDRNPYRGMSFGCAFDRLAELADLAFPSVLGPQLDKPFGDLRVVDEGGTLLVSDEVVTLFDVRDGKPASPNGPLDWKQAEGRFAGYRFAFKLTSPLPVVDSNATRHAGDTSTWEVDLAGLKDILDGKKGGRLWARLRK